MPLRNTLRSRTKRFGENFVDDIILPELEFRLGHVERVFTNRQDLNSYKGKLRFKIPSNPSGCILIKAVKGVLPIFGNESIAKPLLRGISDSIARGDLVLFTDIGNVFEKFNDIEYDELRASYGIQIDFLTPVGAITFGFVDVFKSKEGDDTQPVVFQLGGSF